MLTGDIRSQVDRIWDAFWSGGISNPLEIMLNQPSTERMAHELMHGQTRVRISMGRLRGLELPVPPIAMQREFAQRATAVEALKRTQRVALAELEALFASLEQEMFPGFAG